MKYLIMSSDNLEKLEKKLLKKYNKKRKKAIKKEEKKNVSTIKVS
tara:strand:- start:85 stop:219 length:135 start_codon:yes stop_codon:yes gene_type:complete